MKMWSVIAVSAALASAGCQQTGGPEASESAGAAESVAYGIAFDHAAGQETRPCDDDTPRCMILTEPAAEAFMRDLFTVEVHNAPLEAVAAEEAGFVPDASGKLMTTYGRFEPVPVEAFRVNGASGLRAVIACGISDPETGFHAGAGECLWAVVSDGERSVVIASSGFGNGLDAAEAALASLRFLPPE